MHALYLEKLSAVGPDASLSTLAQGSEDRYVILDQWKGQTIDNTAHTRDTPLHLPGPLPKKKKEEEEEETGGGGGENTHTPPYSIVTSIKFEE